MQCEEGRRSATLAKKKGRRTLGYVIAQTLHTEMNMTKCVGFLVETKTMIKRGANINKEMGRIDFNKKNKNY